MSKIKEIISNLAEDRCFVVFLPWFLGCGIFIVSGIFILMLEKFNWMKSFVAFIDRILIYIGIIITPLQVTLSG